MLFRSTAAPVAPPVRDWPLATDVRLPDGALVSLRDAQRGDAARLRELFYTLSDSTRYLYFCTGVPRNEIWAERVAKLGVSDGRDSYALVAEVGSTLVGVARFDRASSDQRAEIGILLTDAWQSRGLGRAVVSRLQAEAKWRTVAGFTATVLGENRRALRMLRSVYPGMTANWSFGQFTLDMPFEA
jgi:RimJ/RimL family protein N-acetyltransferase